MGTKLGQNFLTSRSIARRIAREADIGPEDVVIEAGPGKGILTEAILENNPKKLIAYELDKKLASELSGKFSSFKNILIIDGDILEFLEKGPRMAGFKITANIPYYLTSRFLRLVFSFRDEKKFPKRVVLMVQKEVAERITAKPPRMNLLALSVQMFGKPRIAFKVSKKYFKPRPKIDSAVLVIDGISRDFFKKDIDEKYFFHLLKSGFAQKRKILAGNLKNYLWKNEESGGFSILKKEELEKIFEKCQISLKARAENLSLDTWKCLYYHLKRN